MPPHDGARDVSYLVHTDPICFLLLVTIDYRGSKARTLIDLDTCIFTPWIRQIPFAFPRDRSLPQCPAVGERSARSGARGAGCQALWTGRVIQLRRRAGEDGPTRHIFYIFIFLYFHFL